MGELELEQLPKEVQTEWPSREDVPRSLQEYFVTAQELEALQHYSDLPLEVALPDEKDRTLYPIPQLARLKDGRVVAARLFIEEFMGGTVVSGDFKPWSNGGLKWCVVDLTGTDWHYAQHFFAKELYYPDNGDMPSPIDPVSRVKGVQLAGDIAQHYSQKASGMGRGRPLTPGDVPNIQPYLKILVEGKTIDDLYQKE